MLSESESLIVYVIVDLLFYSCNLSLVAVFGYSYLANIVGHLGYFLAPRTAQANIGRNCTLSRYCKFRLFLEIRGGGSIVKPNLKHFKRVLSQEILPLWQKNHVKLPMFWPVPQIWTRRSLSICITHLYVMYCCFPGSSFSHTRASLSGFFSACLSTQFTGNRSKYVIFNNSSHMSFSSWMYKPVLTNIWASNYS